MPGPLPNPERVRRNAPTVPTTNLPAGGRRGTAPSAPKSVDLDEAGKAWWKWAWHTPQAAAWSEGDLYVVAHRASLEDDLAALDSIPGVTALFALSGDDLLGGQLKKLASMTAGRTAVLREMRELDDRLGLTPKGLAALRWKIVPEIEEQQAPAAGVANLDDRRRRLTGA